MLTAVILALSLAATGAMSPGVSPPYYPSAPLVPAMMNPFAMMGMPMMPVPFYPPTGAGHYPAYYPGRTYAPVTSMAPGATVATPSLRPTGMYPPGLFVPMLMHKSYMDSFLGRIGHHVPSSALPLDGPFYPPFYGAAITSNMLPSGKVHHRVYQWDLANAGPQLVAAGPHGKPAV
ncbi:hypothetical protein HDE_03795 [Halotydeus destructor]|nr:hypothetical protein HDE_03795 [Halotydeus destructor]